MAYIHNKPDIKVNDCDPQKVKEMLMKYGYGCPGHKYMCEDIDSEFTTAQKEAAESFNQTMKEFEENVKKAAKIRDEKYSIPYPILDEVKKILGGDRRSDYGEANASFKRIADYWNAYLCHKRDKIDSAAHEEDLPYEFLRGAYLTGHDVAILMILFKIAREENKHKHDNLADIIGYATLADNMEE